MNPKIKKLRGELDKNKSKISDLQARNRDIEKQIKELEDFDIVGMVRESGMSLEQFAALFRKIQAAPLPVPEMLNKEDNAHEEN